MITLTIIEQVKTKNRVDYKRQLVLIHSTDQARKVIVPIVKEMKLAKKENRKPSKAINGVSYDTKSERTLLLELDAITSIENESEKDNY